MARLQTNIWLMAHLRRCESEGAFVTIVARGNEEAGAVAYKIYSGQRNARLILQSTNLDGDMIWRDVLGGIVTEDKVDERLRKERNIDPDLWIVEIEQCDGAAFLDIHTDDDY